MRTRLSGAVLAGLVAVTMPAVAAEASATPVVTEPEPALVSASSVASSFVVADSAVRVLDTRTSSGPVPARGSVTVDLSATVPDTATAVVLNVTAVALSEGGTYVTAWQAGTPRPGVSSLNLRWLETRANTVTVPVGTDRKVSLYNHNGDTHLVADLIGHYNATDTAGSSWYNPLTPQRFLDTRTGNPLPAQTTRTVTLADRLPADTTAVVVNVTAVRPTHHTYLSVLGSLTGRPTTSSLNVMPQETTPNLVTVPLTTDHTITVWNNSGTVDVFADLIGYYTPTSGAAFHTITPTRAYDSRTTTWLPPTTQRRVSLDTTVPTQASTVLFNLTGLGNYYPTYLTTWQAGRPRPATSNLNVAPLQSAANHAIVPLGTTRAVDVYNNFGYTDIILDVSGYFAPREA